MKSLRSPALLLALTLAALQVWLLSTGQADPFKDDAYICLRYGKNLVQGVGLVFNPGEYYEGFTTPLWTLLSAAIIALGLPPVGTLKGLGAVAFLGLVAVTWRTSARVLRITTLQVAVPALVAASAAIAYWSLSGLETVAFSTAVAVGLFHMVDAARAGRRGSLSGGVWFGLAVLLRPEALAWFFLAGFALWAWPTLQPRLPGGRPLPSTSDQRPRDNAVRPLVATLLPVVLLAGAWQVFRLAYYGEWLPNTFHAKVEWEAYVLGRGLIYLARSAVSTPYGIFFLVPLLTPRAWRRPEVFFPLLVAAFHTLYLILIGGDYMVFGRFVVPILAPLAVAWGGAIESRWALEPHAPPGAPQGRFPWLTPLRRPASMAALLLASVTAIVPYFQSPSVLDPDDNVVRYRRAGRWIARYLEPTALVATPAIGAVGYLGGTRILDTLGIVDRYLAHYRNPAFKHLHAPAGHARGDGAYVLKRAPDLILLANVWIRPVPLLPEQVAANPATLSLTDRLLFGMPEFLQRYEIVSYKLKDGQWFGMAVRRDSPWHPDSPAWHGPRPDVRSP